MEKKFFTVGHKCDFFFPNKSGWGGIREMEEEEKTLVRNKKQNYSKNLLLCIILILKISHLN